MSTIRNPHLNGLKAKAEAAQAHNLLKKYFGRIQKVGRKQVYLIKGASPFYIWVVSAPSNLKFELAIKGLIKEYGQYPLYVLFTRDVNTYPTTAGQTYWDKIKTVYKKANRSFKGAIMGLNEFDKQMAELMKENAKIKLDYNRYIDITNGNVTIEQVLKELAGLTPKKLKAIMPVLKLINQ